jgi:hypothetical protein
MPQPTDPTPQGEGVKCKIGGHTTTVDTPKTCTDLGGEVVPPKSPGGGICGGCGKDIAAMAKGLGLTDQDVIAPSRALLEASVKVTPKTMALVKSMTRADEYITATIRDNPSILGDVMKAMVTGAEFAELVLSKPGGKVDKLKLPKVTEKYFKRSLKGLRKGSRNKKFHKELDFLEKELKRWSRKTVAQVRTRLLGK